MTEQTTSAEPAQETLSQRSARRLRGALAENRIPGVAVAKALHLPQQTLSRKLNGQTAFAVDELELVAGVLDLGLDQLMGIGDWADRPIGLVRLRDPSTMAPSVTATTVGEVPPSTTGG